MSSRFIHEQKGPLPVLGHVGVAVGKMMLVWGGYTTQGIIHNGIVFQAEPYLDPGHVWIYDPEYLAWKVVTTTGDIPLGTSGAGAVVMDSFLYVFGGFHRTGNTSDLYKLNLNTMVWEYLDFNPQEQPSPRDKFMHWCHEEKFYIFGGFGIPLNGYLNDNGSFVADEDEDTMNHHSLRGWNNQLCIYDTTTNKWTNPKCSGNIPSARAAGASARIGNNVYVFGGRHGSQRLRDIYVLDLRTLHWTRLHPHSLEPCGRSWHTFTPVSDSQIVLYGGYTQERRTLDDLWLFDVSRVEWLPIERTGLTCRLWHSACLTDRQDLVVFGGCSNDINEEQAKCLNDVTVLKFSPHSLLRLCLDASHKHRHLLGRDIDSLPRVLLQRLQKRLSQLPREQREGAEGGGGEDSGDGEDPSHARTCSLS